MKKIFRIGLVLIIASTISIITAHLWVEKATDGMTYNSVSKIPYRQTGLLLGTGKYLQNGRKNAYYAYRINAAENLYKAGKIKYVLVSGDNGSKNYDEPTQIKEDLIARGIPASRIYLDYAGFRTWDSMIRCKKIFNQSEITVISQQFHNERAIFIGKWKGVDAIGYNASKVSYRYGIKVKIREAFARVKLLLDLAFNTSPKFLGEPVKIG